MSLISHRTVKICITFMLCGITYPVRAQSSSDVEFAEMKLNLAASVENVRDLQEQLEATQKKVFNLSETISRLQTQLTIARNEVVTGETKLEAFSLNSVTQDVGLAKQERTLQLLSDLKISRDRLDLVQVEGKKLCGVLDNVAENLSALDSEKADKLSQSVQAFKLTLSKGDLESSNASINLVSSGNQFPVLSVTAGLGVGIVRVGNKTGIRPGLTFKLVAGNLNLGHGIIVEPRKAVIGFVMLTNALRVEHEKQPELLTAIID